MVKVYLCAFADSRYNLSADRLKSQASKFYLFEKIFLYDEKSFSTEFNFELAQLQSQYPRGYGYWKWKPKLILEVMEKIPDDALLLYLDVGCHLNNAGMRRFIKYIDHFLQATQNMMVFQQDGEKFSEGIWTKGDVLDYFKVRKHDKIIYSGQILSGIIFLKNNKSSKLLIERWWDVYENNYDLVTDNPSISPNLPGFIQNRHDQSIFSILCKLNGELVLSSSEVEGISAIIGNYPILAIRDIGDRMYYPNLFLLRFTRMLKHPVFTISTLFRKYLGKDQLLFP